MKWALVRTGKKYHAIVNDATICGYFAAIVQHIRHKPKYKEVCMHCWYKLQGFIARVK